MEDVNQLRNTHIYIIGASGKCIRLSIEMMGDLSHLEGTVIAKKFLVNNGMVIEPLELPYSDKLLDYLIPLIRWSDLTIPPAKLFTEMANMLRFLAGASELWTKYAKILAQGVCYDILGARYALKDEIFVGSCFTTWSHVLFCLEQPDTDIVDNILNKYQILRFQPLWTTCPSDDVVLAIWKKSVKESLVLSPPLIFFKISDEGDGVSRDHLCNVLWMESDHGVDVGPSMYKKIIECGGSYTHLFLPTFYWV